MTEYLLSEISETVRNYKTNAETQVKLAEEAYALKFELKLYSEK